MLTKKNISLWLPPIISLCILLFADLDPDNPAITATAAVASLMAMWWITEAIPLAVTALLPIVLFPLLGVMNGKAVSGTYINHIIFLFIGGFMVALAMEKWGLHRRIALRILMLFGGNPKMVILGFMCATAFLSMWISNTATAMMMVPIVLAITAGLEEQINAEGERTAFNQFSIGLLLSVAYSASIGGTATLIGTPPNLSFSRILAITFPQAPEISFAQWMQFAIPTTILFLLITWLLLCILFTRNLGAIKFDRNHFKTHYQNLGTASFEEKAVFSAFISMALLWIFRADLKLGFLTIPGWSNLFSDPKYINDGTVAIIIAIILFIIPSKQQPNDHILNTDVFSKIPWHIVILFGGGFALASAFLTSGLSNYIAHQLTGLSEINPLHVIASIAVMVTFMTELTSNTATTEMLLPTLAAMAVAIKVNPLLLMIPATLSASFAFMLPVATPPNAIVFACNRVRIIDMVKTGFILNLIGVVLITLSVYLWAQTVFDIDLSTMPDWAVLKK